MQACIDAINYATESFTTENPIRVINLSLETMEENDAFEEAIRGYPGLIICGSGNHEYDLDDEEIVRYPSYYGSERCDDPVDNMIVVGAIDQNKKRSVWKNFLGLVLGGSNYGESTVNIYAPGSDIFSTFSPSPLYESLNGTSMAAPFVTGVAALLLSVNPDLTPVQLKECILSGAENITITEISSSLTHESKKLDAWGAFMYLMENYTPQIVIPKIPFERELDVDNSSEYYFKKNPTVKLTLRFDEEFEFELIGSENPVNVTLYDSQMNEIDISKIWNNNKTTVRFVKELQKGTYYLSGSCEGDLDKLILQISHEHSMNESQYYSESLHIESCACGEKGIQTSQHVVLAGSISNNKGLCMYCGAILYLLNDVHLGLLSISQYSVNGSYILPNGVIVLVDEDVEAYLNGALVFYDKDSLPVTQ